MRRPQFSLKSLLSLMAVVAVSLVIGGKIGDHETKRRRRALQEAFIQREAAKRQAFWDTVMNWECGTK